MARKAPGAGKISSKRRRQSVKNTKKKIQDMNMISGLKYVPNFTRRMSKETDKGCSRFIKASLTVLLLEV